jgi:hypothetical protein
VKFAQLSHCSGSGDSSDMGNQSSTNPKAGALHQPPHSIGSMGPLRKSTMGPRRPMPDEHELERRFNEVLLQMDLPPERAKHLRSFDSSKKWDIICDQVSQISQKKIENFFKSYNCF